MAQIIDGKAISKEIQEELRLHVATMTASGVTPCLAVILVGDDPASRVYAHGKQKACEQVGVLSKEYFLPSATTQEELLALIDTLNKTDDVDGILLEMPLPKHINANTVSAAIAPEKDVDCCGPVNIGCLFMGNHRFSPCTPSGCMELLDRSGVDLCGKRCVVVGRSNFVGKPMAMLLMERNATITICHSRTENLSAVTREADILVSAVGKAKFITADMVKPGAVVLDVGINRDENGKLCGDVDFASVEPVASRITPVPGGVGPMTVTVLLQNTVKSAERRQQNA
jgi:methylenetetrahydrofolate dehydrogenase (NADP+)/methenyltetrahydrofolate cyclohydrolase